MCLGLPLPDDNGFDSSIAVAPQFWITDKLDLRVQSKHCFDNGVCGDVGRSHGHAISIMGNVDGHEDTKHRCNTQALPTHTESPRVDYLY